jgi:transcriptional regulator with XRE-family HTH domain
MKAVQLRMARAAVRWGVRELAEKAGVTANTVSRIELGADAKQSTIDAIRRVLEAAGVEFTHGEKLGVLVAPGTVPTPAASKATSRKKARQAIVAAPKRGRGGAAK